MKKLAIASAAVLVALTGCKSSRIEPATLEIMDNTYASIIEEAKLTTIDSFTAKRLSTYESLSDNYVILTAHNKDHYLLKTRGTCDELHDMRALKLWRWSDLAVTNQGDRIYSNNYRCYISKIYPITNNQRLQFRNVERELTGEELFEISE